MKYNIKLAISIVSFFFFSYSTCGQESWDSEQKQVIETIGLLSETTAPDGKGAAAYGNYLSEDFSRWTVGDSLLTNKTKWVDGVREWFDDGWRVSDRKQEILEILIMNDLAHTRRIVTETYLGPKGDTSSSKAALAELWNKENGKWLLYRVNVHPIPKD